MKNLTTFGKFYLVVALSVLCGGIFFGLGMLNAAPQKANRRATSQLKRPAAAPAKNGSAKAKEDDDDKDSGKQKDSDAGKDIYSTISLVPFEYSRSNNPKTSFTVNRAKAKAISDKINSSGANDRNSLVALMSASRLEGAGVATAISVAKKFLAIEMQANIDNDLPDFVKLEMVLSSIQAKKYSLAEYFLFELKASENMLVRAAAFNAEGIIFALDKKLPEAEISWREALKAVPNYKAARMNLGFYGLKYADFKLAKALLGDLQKDVFAAAGLMSAERMSGKPDRASALCDKILRADPKFKEMLFNCGLNEFQGTNDFDKALGLFKKVIKIPTLSTDIDELAYAQMSKVDEARAKAKAGAKARAQD